MALFSLAHLSRIRTTARQFVGVAALVLAVATTAAPSEAQPRAAASGEQKATKTPETPLLAVVSIARQRIQVYDGTGLVAESPVSTGTAGHRTPTGVFSILQKRRHHRSNIYSNAPMPYMQRLTWSGIALHAGVLPGYPASHGCIRLPHRFAAELWRMTRLGTRVVVAPDDAPALPIEDPRLPAPKLTPMPSGDDRLHEEAAAIAYGPALASAAGRSIVDAEGQLGPPGVSQHVLHLSPWQRAKAARALAAKTATIAAKTAKLAAEAAAARAAEARGGVAALDEAELALAAAQRRQETAARAAAAASELPAAERASEALAAAEDSLARAQRLAEAAALNEAALRQQAFEAATAAAETEEARRNAIAAAKAADRAVAPISIFVSRKAGRVYVRQGWEPVHEAPAQFLDEGPALGTHVYLAMGPTADRAALRWLSVSLPASAPRPRGLRGRRGEPAPAPDRLPGLSQETAAGALARFELPEDTRRFIADRLWAGATLIVSEHGLSGETGVGTDFIVLTR